MPADQRTHFLDEFYPRLSRLAPVASSDTSFTPPAVAPPELVLRAAYGDGHALTVRVGMGLRGGRNAGPLPARVLGRATRPSATSRTSGRALDALDLPPFATGLLRGGRTRFRRCCRRSGSTGSTPCGSAPRSCPCSRTPTGSSSRSTARRRSTGRRATSLQVGVSTAESDAGTDWFDLGIRISVEGRDVPFADVFGALAAGESHLLLPDGAYFSLQKPELQALRTLIEEARALQDSPSGPLRLSRFQAGLWDELAALGVVDAQARAWQQQVTGLLADGGPAATPRPRGSARTAASLPARRVSTGCASCGGTGSAACSPTTWGWARRCRRSP